jgi:ABC-type glutathione transport system ATPase component
MTVADPIPAVHDVLRVRDLTVAYGDAPPAVNAVSFELRAGELLGLVGESGSGKTTTGMAVLGLIKPPGRILGGSVELGATDLLRLDRKELRDLRWRSISFVPQGAMNALTPTMRIEGQIEDAIQAHERVPRAEIGQRIRELLEAVELPVSVARKFPHELSGGMKQRVCIAMAIALNPQVIVADEPTSALDVVVQRAIAETLADIQQRLGVSVLLIGHDMALQAQLADRIGVMWQGRLVEIGPVVQVYKTPRHPYTQLLLRSIPSLRQARWHPPAELATLRHEAQGHIDGAVQLRRVGDDHLAAIP